MTEQTDKTSRKSSKAAPKKRPASSRAPKSKRAKTPGRSAARAKKEPAGTSVPSEARLTKAPEAVSLAPDPATIIFGSNRPIVAQPQKLPESSGLRFSGPSNGELKGSGPQPSSAKASGLTFTNAKSPATASSSAKPSGGNGGRPPGSGTTAPPAAKRGEVKPGETRKPEADKNTAANGKTEGAKTTGKPAFTKPAIAPQTSGRRLEKERSPRGFVATLLGLAVVVAGLAYWLNSGTQPDIPTSDQATLQPAPAPEFAAPEPAAPMASPEPAAPAASEPEVPSFGPSPRAPVSPGPLVATPAPAGGAATLSVAEIAEIQQLLERLDLAPGNIDGMLTADTTAAIRSYQEMAGLTGDGEPNRALLEELRSVVELYGG